MIKMIRLTPDQQYFLKIFTGYKAFARKENFVQDQRYLKGDKVSKSYDELETELLALNVLKRDKAGRVSLKMEWQDARNLMSAQNETVEELQNELVTHIHGLKEYSAQIETLSALNPRWPSNDHFTLEAALEQKRIILKQIANIENRIKMLQGE